MLISDSHKFVFLHNPKTAGTSARSALRKYDSTDEKFWRTFDSRLRLRDMAHMPMAELKCFFPDEFEKVSRYFTFGFVRDPLARFVSGFNETHKSLYKDFAAGLSSIDVYRDELRKYTGKVISKPDAVCPYVHVVPQHQIYCIGEDCHANLVIKIEDPLKSRELLVAAIGRPGEELFLNLVDVNRRKNVKSLNHPITDLLDRRQFEALVQYYRRDFEQFGYAAPVD